MEVILQANVDNLGFRGDIIKVKDGYARNYLIPCGLAVEATKSNIIQMGEKKEKIEVLKVRERETAEQLKNDLEQIALEVVRKVGEKGVLYGSVTTLEIRSLLAKKGYDFDKRKISTNEPIKRAGDFEIYVNIHPQVTASLKLTVISEEDWEQIEQARTAEAAAAEVERMTEAAEEKPLIESTEEMETDLEIAEEPEDTVR